MNSDPHHRARDLAAETRISEISPEDARWLRRHATECPECALYVGEMEAVVDGLQSFAFEPDPAMTARIQRRLAIPLRKPSRARWWAMAAALVLAVGLLPVYNGVRESRREKAEALLMEEVESRVSRAVPVAMEPLLQPQPEESK